MGRACETCERGGSTYQYLQHKQTQLATVCMDDSSSATCKKPENQPLDALLQQQCSDEHLVSLSMLVSDWTAISPHLGLTRIDEEDIIEYAPRSVATQRIAMLRKWREKNGAAATYKKLCDVFRKCERQDLVDKIRLLLTSAWTCRSIGILNLHVRMCRQ